MLLLIRACLLVPFLWMISSAAWAGGTYRIAFDCFSEGVSYTGSNNDLWVEVWENREKRTSGLVKMPDSVCERELPGLADGWHQFAGLDQELKPGWQPGADPQVTRHIFVRILATGDDAAWLDRLALIQGCGFPRDYNCGDGDITWGVDGEKGYCLSTDAADSFGATRQSGSCSPCWDFLPDGTIKACNVRYGAHENAPAPIGSAAATPDTTYSIKIKTGTRSGAGTDSNIFLTIYGENGKSPEIRLNGYLSGNAFEGGDEDKLKLTSTDVGPITRVKVRTDNK